MSTKSVLKNKIRKRNKKARKVMRKFPTKLSAVREIKVAFKLPLIEAKRFYEHLEANPLPSEVKHKQPKVEVKAVTQTIRRGSRGARS